MGEKEVEITSRAVIPRLDRGIQRKDLNFPVKSENDTIVIKLANIDYS